MKRHSKGGLRPDVLELESAGKMMIRLHHSRRLPVSLDFDMLFRIQNRYHLKNTLSAFNIAF